MKRLEAGGLVKNLNNNSIGVLVERSSIHDCYWKVFSQGSVLDWHIFNIGCDNERSRHKNSL